MEDAIDGTHSPVRSVDRPGDAPVVIYSKDHCSSCVRAKRLLDATGARYDEIDLTGDLDGMRHVARLTGRTTLPQVMIGGEHIGGFEDLQLALQNPRIRAALEATA
ncbi:MAG: glutaredoxin [Actinobacteria bacterium]|nr:glutaredoxin [Actinomycetota bacterium]